MRETKSFIALSSLDVYELNRFKKFVHSPYFNVNERITHLFTLFETFIRDTPDASFDKKHIWKQIYPEREYNDTVLRKLNSDFLKLLEQFLAQNQFDQNPLHRANYLLKALSARKLDKLYKSSISSARRLSEHQLERTASYYYYQYQIEKNLYSLSNAFEKKSTIKSDSILENLVTIGHNLDIFYLTEKIRYYYTFITLKNIAPVEKEVFPIENIVEEIEKLDYESYPPLAIYYQIYKTFALNKGDEDFKKMKQLVSQHLEIFPIGEAKDIYEATINYCVGKVNQGHQEYFQEMFDLFQYGLEAKLLILDNQMDPAVFRNICITGLRLKKFDWTELFIQNFSQYLAANYRENAIIFNRARLETYKRNFEKVIELLREVTFEDLVYELSSKALQIVAYYELDEYEVLISFLSSFSALLRRNTKLPQRRKNNYQKLIFFTRKLIRLTPRMKTEIQKLKDEIETSDNFADKTWLLEKIAELQGNPQPATS